MTFYLVLPYRVLFRFWGSYLIIIFSSFCFHCLSFSLLLFPFLFLSPPLLVYIGINVRCWETHFVLTLETHILCSSFFVNLSLFVFFCKILSPFLLFPIFSLSSPYLSLSFSRLSFSSIPNFFLFSYSFPFFYLYLFFFSTFFLLFYFFSTFKNLFQSFCIVHVLLID